MGNYMRLFEEEPSVKLGQDKRDICITFDAKVQEEGWVPPPVKWREALRAALREVGQDEGCFGPCPICGEGTVWPEAYDLDRHDEDWLDAIAKAMEIAVKAGLWPTPHEPCVEQLSTFHSAFGGPAWDSPIQK